MILSPAVFPTNICPSKLSTVPLIAEATINKIPAPPMIQVSTVCKIAAVFAPIMLISIIKNATIIATASHEAYTSNPATVYRYPFKNPGHR